jgi:hypothetical protein
MALSARMQALIDKIDAADVQHFVKLRELARTQSMAREKNLEKRRENLRRARAVQAANRKKLKPDI